MPGKPTKCLFCGQERKLVEAHIYPRAFVRDRSEEGQHNYLIGTKREYASRSPTGIYDDGIVCNDCEQRFGPYDSYAHQFFQLKDAVLVPDPNGGVLMWTTPVDYSRLKLFLLSVLWRAGVSTRPECVGTKLGKYEQLIRQMIESGDPGPPTRFPILLQRYDKGGAIAPLAMPERRRLKESSVNFYKLDLAGCAAWVAIDERPLLAVLQDVALAPWRPAFLLAKDFIGSNDFQRLMGVMHKLDAANRFPKLAPKRPPHADEPLSKHTEHGAAKRRVK